MQEHILERSSLSTSEVHSQQIKALWTWAYAHPGPNDIRKTHVSTVHTPKAQETPAGCKQCSAAEMRSSIQHLFEGSMHFERMHVVYRRPSDLPFVLHVCFHMPFHFSLVQLGFRVWRIRLQSQSFVELRLSPDCEGLQKMLFKRLTR